RSALDSRTATCGPRCWRSPRSPALPRSGARCSEGRTAFPCRARRARLAFRFREGIPPMSDLMTLFRRAADGFGARVHQIADGQWHNDTPCTDWDVRVLVNHVTVEQLWVPPLTGGSTIADVGDTLDGDQLGDDPVAAWDAAVAASAAAFGTPEGLAGSVPL